MNDRMAELQQLCEALIEERSTDEQHARLQALLREDEAARAWYVRYLHLHAALQWSGTGLGEPSTPALPPQGEPGRRTGGLATFLLRGTILLALAAGIVLALWVTLRPSSGIATLESGKSCKWDEGTLPTQLGARLGPGRLRLADGLATIVFASGAEVTLEAPADLELVSARRCVLHAGRLVAHVPPQAIGFVVDTPTAKLEDLGTEFGVHVRDGQTADVSVFGGIVDARHHGTGKKERLVTGQRRRFGLDTIRTFDPNEEPAPRRETPIAPADQVLHLSTATGRGRDAYVQPLFPSEHHSDILLLVKNTREEKSNYNRKAYVGLDLRPLAGRRISEAQLTFAFAPTGMGFASRVPDATFAVYGLLDENQDDWDEKTIRWNDAPANRPGGAELDFERVQLLGTFVIRQGQMHGTRSVSGKPLVDFLNRDRNRLATFILVRQTQGDGRGDLVHGFAGKNHPTLPPPTLKVVMAPGSKG